MALKGNTGSIDLAHVFQMLTLSEKTGTLVIYNGGSRTSLYLNGSGVLYPYDKDAFPAKILRMLVRLRELDHDEVEGVRASCKALGKNVLDTLVEMHRINEKRVLDAQKLQMEEEIFDLFFSADVSFEFFEGRRPDSEGLVIDERLLLNPSNLIMEAARRMDEWRYIQQIIPTENCVYEIAANLDCLPEEESDAAIAEVYSFIDGFRSVGAIVEQTSLPRYQVFKKMVVLSESRIAYEIALEVLLERASECVQTQRFETGLGLLERAFELGVQEPHAHEMAALACQAINRLGRACHHYSLVASALEAKGARTAAAEIYLRVRDIVPTDVHARERLLSVYMSDPSFFQESGYDVVTEVVELAPILQAIGRDQDASAILLEVHHQFVDNSKVSLQLAQVAVDLANPKAAVAILSASAEAYFEQRDFPQALRLYRRIRAVDPSHSGIEWRMQSCQDSLEKGQPKSKPFLRLALILLVLGGGDLAYWRYHTGARQALKKLKIEELALAGEFTGALAILENFQRDYPITIPAAVAKRISSDLRAREAKYRTEMAEVEGRDRADRQKRQQQAEFVLESALKELKEGSYAKALELLRKIEGLSSDRTWSEQQGVPKMIADIQSYLERSDALHKDMEAQASASRWDLVHKAGVDLLKNYPRSPWCRDLMLPVQIVTEPTGCRLTWKLIALSTAPAQVVTAPTVLQLPADQEIDVKVERDGYYPSNFRLRAIAGPEVLVRLDRKPDLQQKLTPPALFPPLFSGDVMFIGCEDGRITALDNSTGESRWKVTLPELQEIAAPPIYYNGKIIALGSVHLLQVYDAQGGRPEVTIPLESRALRAPAVYRGILLIAVVVEGTSMQRLLAFNLTDGRERWRVDRQEAIAVGPEAVADGFLVGLVDGTLLRLDGRTADVLEQWKLGSEPTSVHVSGESFFVGTQDGHLLRFDIGQKNPVWTQTLPSKQGVQELFSLGEHLFAVAKPDLHQILLKDGTVTASSSGTVLGPVAFVSRSGIYVASSSNRILLLSLADLTLKESFRTEKPVTIGAGGEGFAAFLSKESGLVILRSSR